MSATFCDYPGARATPPLDSSAGVAADINTTIGTWERTGGKQVFINLPVADLPRSVAFFSALGFSQKPAVHR